MEKQNQKSNLLLNSNQRVFFIGLGGISMGGLAQLALNRGQIVGGSDLSDSPRTQSLVSKGAQFYLGQSAEHILDFRPDAVVYSAAISPDNPERQKADELGIPTFERAQWLGLINRQFPQVINVAGTNGKSTTTAMTAHICTVAGLDPTVHLGAEFREFNGTMRIGGSKLMISEACEFQKSFLAFWSTTAAVLNIGHDHVDCYPTLKDVIDVFADFIRRLDPKSNLVIPTFDPNVSALLEQLKDHDQEHLNSLNLLTFGYEGDHLLGKDPDLTVKTLTFENGLPQAELAFRGEPVGSLRLSIPGRFNVENALAALLLSYIAGVPWAVGLEALTHFSGVEGRFTYLGRFHGAQIINDYAHHPDSIRLTLEAAQKLPHRRLWPCFQPITYSRAKGLFQGYVDVLKTYEHAVLLEVYDDRERDHSFSSKMIADEIQSLGGTASYFENTELFEAFLRKELQPDDLVVLMGQSIRSVGDHLVNRLNHQQELPSLWENKER